MPNLVFVATLLCLVAVSTQHQPPGVPPRQQNQPQGGGGGGGHGHHGKPLEFASEVHNADHILEHLENVVATKSKEEMTEEELEFHYFKLHDYDNNNKLDGVEIGKALTHFHDDGNGQDANSRLHSDEEMAEVIDAALETDDLNGDGYVEFPEFMAAQERMRHGGVFEEDEDGMPPGFQEEEPHAPAGNQPTHGGARPPGF